MLTIDKNTWQVDPKYLIKVKMTACIMLNLWKVTFHLLQLGQKNTKGSQLHTFHKYANTTITIFRNIYSKDLVKRSHNQWFHYNYVRFYGLVRDAVTFNSGYLSAMWYDSGWMAVISRAFGSELISVFIFFLFCGPSVFAADLFLPFGSVNKSGSLQDKTIANQKSNRSFAHALKNAQQNSVKRNCSLLCWTCADKLVQCLLSSGKESKNMEQSWKDIAKGTLLSKWLEDISAWMATKRHDRINWKLPNEEQMKTAKPQSEGSTIWRKTTGNHYIHTYTHFCWLLVKQLLTVGYKKW